MPQRLLLIAILLSVLFVACKEVFVPRAPASLQEMWDCNEDSGLDSLALRNALVGEWEWEYVSCFWTPNEASKTSSDGVSITFEPDGSLIVYETGKLVEAATWQLGPGDSGTFEMQTNPRVNYLYGRILLCKDRVLFNHSYIDGCDNYFKRN